MQSEKFGDWNIRQLQYKQVTLMGQIDGLVGYRNSLYEELRATVQSISNLEELKRSVDIGQDQDTLEHMRNRELELRQDIRDTNSRIRQLQEELEPIQLELAGREPGDEAVERYINSRRRDTEKSLKRIRNEHLGVAGRLRAWLFGD